MANRFHAATLRELGIPYVRDDAATKALDARAAELGITLPASFVEWYGMNDGLGRMQQHSNTDHPLPISELGAADEQAWTTDSPHGRMLPFMIENQGVCVWAVVLDGSDDPPVFVAIDPAFVWQSHATSFSVFIACQVWDHPEDNITLCAQASELSADDLAHLRATFRERTTTHGWPTRNIYRFERDDARILVWDAEGQADWLLMSASEDALASLARDVWRCGDLRTSLYDTDTRGERILRGLRADE